MEKRFLFNGIDMECAGISVGYRVEFPVVHPTVMTVAQFPFAEGAFIGTDLTADAPGLIMYNYLCRDELFMT